MAKILLTARRRTRRILIFAMRRWRSAHDAGEPAQAALFAGLAPYGFGALAPVLDSLITLFEASMERVFRAGPARARTLSGDERRLLDLLETGAGPDRPDRSPMENVLQIAIRSTRIMIDFIGRALPDDIGGGSRRLYAD
jgi:hypothetical protein